MGLLWIVAIVGLYIGAQADHVFCVRAVHELNEKWGRKFREHGMVLVLQPQDEFLSYVRSGPWVDWVVGFGFEIFVII